MNNAKTSKLFSLRNPDGKEISLNQTIEGCMAQARETNCLFDFIKIAHSILKQRPGAISEIATLSGNPTLRNTIHEQYTNRGTKIIPVGRQFHANCCELSRHFNDYSFIERENLIAAWFDPDTYYH